MGNVLHPDLLLARRAVKNDGRAWEEIVGLLGERIYNLALRFAGSPGEAEELTQDVFLRLYRSLGQYRGEVPCWPGRCACRATSASTTGATTRNGWPAKPPAKSSSNSSPDAATPTVKPNAKKNAG